MDEAVGEPIWSLPPDTLKLTQALPSPGWGGRCQAEFTQVITIFFDDKQRDLVPTRADHIKECKICSRYLAIS